MTRKSKQNGEETGKGPSPAAGLLFMLGGLGFFYSILSIVDPLL